MNVCPLIIFLYSERFSKCLSTETRGRRSLKFTVKETEILAEEPSQNLSLAANWWAYFRLTGKWFYFEQYKHASVSKEEIIEFLLISLTKTGFS